MTDTVTIRRHYKNASDALASLQDALACLEELDPAVGFVWDTKGLAKSYTTEAIALVTSIKATYEKEMR